MAAASSTLRTYPVGGQIDPAWLVSSVPWSHVRATATLSRPDGGAPVVDPTNGAHEHPTTVVNTLTAAAADGQWATAPLKPTTSTGADLALTPSGLTWEITVEIKRGATWHEVITYTVAPSGDRDYDGEGELIEVDGDDCIDVNALIPPPASVPASSIFEDAVLEVLTDNPAAIAADLSVSRTSTTVTVASSTGTDAVLPAATTSLAGQLTAADKTRVDGIDAINATLAAAVSTSAGAADGSKLVKLNASTGLLTTTLLQPWLRRFGSTATTGTLDFNDATNATHGIGYSLLRGSTASNAPIPGSTSFWMSFCFEHASTDGSGNLTQLAIPYANSITDGIWMRGRFSGTWGSWRRIDASVYTTTITGDATTTAFTVTHNLGTSHPSTVSIIENATGTYLNAGSGPTVAIASSSALTVTFAAPPASGATYAVKVVL